MQGSGAGAQVNFGNPSQRDSWTLSRLQVSAQGREDCPELSLDKMGRVDPQQGPVLHPSPLTILRQVVSDSAHLHVPWLQNTRDTEFQQNFQGCWCHRLAGALTNCTS